MRERQLLFVQARLRRERRLIADLISAVMTESQLDSKPLCLKGLTIREAWVSWSAEFCPLDKAPNK